MQKKENTKVVILCGGMGTRLREQTEFMPKPLVKIGDMPILWHIMKLYSYYGYNDFVLCLGYKGDMIKEFFINFEWMTDDITLNLKSGRQFVTHTEQPHDWNITFANTGQDTLTGLRVKKIEKYIKGDFFLATYGDGVSDVNIGRLADFHHQKKKMCTLTAIHPISRFGVIETDGNGLVKGFHEKPVMEDLINGGFFAFNTGIFDHLGDNTMLEDTTLPKLSRMNEVAAYKHSGFWHCMDTYRDYEFLNKLWSSGNARWKIWR